MVGSARGVIVATPRGFLSVQVVGQRRLRGRGPIMLRFVNTSGQSLLPLNTRIAHAVGNQRQGQLCRVGLGELVTFTSIGSSLLQRYISDFRNSMNLFNAWPDYPYYMKSEAYSMFGKGRKALIFKENPKDRWGLWKPLPGTTDLSSVLGHRCSRLGKISLMSVYPAFNDCCFVCSDPMPESLVGLWKMQNWDQITTKEK